MILGKIPGFLNDWERFWEFEDFSWDLLCFKSSNTFGIRQALGILLSIFHMRGRRGCERDGTMIARDLKRFCSGSCGAGMGKTGYFKLFSITKICQRVNFMIAVVNPMNSSEMKSN